MIYSDQPDDDRAKTYENRIIYSLPCRMGLWNEDLAIQENKNAMTAYKRDHCQMLIQKTKKMMRNILKPATLAIETTYVQYGLNYQIKTSDLTGNLKMSDSKALYLSGLITEKEIDTCQHFKHGCMITATPLKDPFIRNTFTIVGCNEHKSAKPVVYGEDLMIKISESDAGPLFIQCENSTIDTFGNHLSLRLSRVPDFYCRFKVLHWDPKMRVETQGSAFTPDKRVIIQHTASGQNLAVELNQWIPSFFGTECIVSCHTYRDSHKMETAENFWMFVSDPKVQTNLFVRAAKGEDIPTDVFE
ncbi:cilia- and flagella-associated protein 161 [Anthonomus grandis grandis]|uniref:cilia- and flagella-associated protein 161 n=1 Tax=Anthonomus grandis grandis TaxID=2921223 RepID=UPI00216590CE|nr:cilia- and flagella-associated protein 161 [Anthonomus grandis grandis]